MMINFTPVKPASPIQESRPDERRCACGSLLARLCARGVELKCRRCKRVVVIPWSTSASWHGLAFAWQVAGDRG